MRKFFLLFCLVFNTCFSQEILLPYSEDVKLTNEYQDMQWNRYVVDNFTILSINDKQGRWLYNNINNLKNSCLSRWGISNYDLKNECRIMVVPNKDLLKKFFNIEENHVEFRERDGKIEVIAVWLCLDEEENKKDDLSRIITAVCIKDLMLFKNINKKFIEVGMSLLNESKDKIKNNIENIKEFDLKFLNIEDIEYKKLDFNQRLDFNNKSLLVCLMLKKEFGEYNFLKLLLNNENSTKSIEKVYSFTPDEFSKTMDRYFLDIKNSIKNKSFNDRYLNIERGLK